MATPISPRKKSGPPGRASVSIALSKRPGLGDPRARGNADLLTTNARTARGIPFMNLGFTANPPPTPEERFVLIEAWAHALQTALIDRSLMETDR